MLKIFVLFILTFFSLNTISEAQDIPALKRNGNATQLFVNGKPFLMISGELHNSSSSSLDYLEPVWPGLKNLNLNSVIAGINFRVVIAAVDKNKKGVIGQVWEGKYMENKWIPLRLLNGDETSINRVLMATGRKLFPYYVTAKDKLLPSSQMILQSKLVKQY